MNVYHLLMFIVRLQHCFPCFPGTLEIEISGTRELNNECSFIKRYIYIDIATLSYYTQNAYYSCRIVMILYLSYFIILQAKYLASQGSRGLYVRK